MSEQLDEAVTYSRKALVQNLRDLCLDTLKHNCKGKAWKDLTEDEQKNIVQRIESGVVDAAEKAVTVIASEGRKHVKALLKQVTVKDGVKCQLECGKETELLHDLIDKQGDFVIVVLSSVEDFGEEMEPAKIDKDQPDLPIENQADGEDNDNEDDEAEEDESDDDAEDDDADEDEDDDGFEDITDEAP